MPSHQTAKPVPMKCLFILSLFVLIHPTFSQTRLPVISATSTTVSINDGGYLDKNAWTLSPDTRPDVYTATRSRKPKWVTFYTDIDSIRVNVKPGTRFSFIILLHGKDSCYTQIASALPSEPPKVTGKKTDTIPFRLTEHQAIHVKAIVNQSDTLNLHFDTGTLRFRITKNALQAKPQMAIDQIETLQMGSLVWHRPQVNPAQVAAHQMDGRFGWEAFDDRILEINYDRNQILVHSLLPAKAKRYKKANIRFVQNLFCMDASLAVGTKKYKGTFLLDTGSDLAMVLDSTWAAKQNFPTDLPLLKKSSFKDGAGHNYETQIVSVPQLHLAGEEITQVPTSVLGSKTPVGFEINCLGNEVLKRFNLIIDLQTDIIYLKKNRLAGTSFKTTL